MGMALFGACAADVPVDATIGSAQTRVNSRRRPLDLTEKEGQTRNHQRGGPALERTARGRVHGDCALGFIEGVVVSTDRRKMIRIIARRLGVAIPFGQSSKAHVLALGSFWSRDHQPIRYAGLKELSLWLKAPFGTWRAFLIKCCDIWNCSAPRREYESFEAKKITGHLNGANGS